MDLQTAQAIAEKMVCDLQGVCERIEIAGSIRRCKEEVKDIDIVCIPRIHYSLDMFQEPTGDSWSELDEELGMLWTSGVFEYKMDGPKHKQLVMLHHPVTIELWCVTPPADWGVQMLIRTGPAAFSHQCVTQRKFTTRPIDGIRYPGLLPSNAQVRGGAVWTGETHMPMPEEANFLEYLGLGQVEPKDRKPGLARAGDPQWKN